MGSLTCLHQSTWNTQSRQRCDVERECDIAYVTIEQCDCHVWLAVSSILGFPQAATFRHINPSCTPRPPHGSNFIRKLVFTPEYGLHSGAWSV